VEKVEEERMKVLLVITYNNGYGCACCAENWSCHEWVEKKEYPRGRLLRKALQARKIMSETHECRMVLESDGEVLYGFDCDICRMGERLFWQEGEDKRLLFDLDDKATLVKAVVIIRKVFPLVSVKSLRRQV